MKITQVYGFAPEEIEALNRAGKIIGELAAAYNAPAEDAEKTLDEATIGLLAALKEVIERLN